ncbi:MAG: hypothetical protein H6745_06175 [Deltaproteobacteria bacterium]|nr:hypothetical protein [Deltaproteobacteria bacterium]
MSHPHICLRVALLAALALPAAACAGLETGNGHNGPVTLSAAFELAAGDPVDSGGREFTLDGARANVRRVDLDLPAGESCVGIAGLLDGAVVDDSAPHTSVCLAGGAAIRLNGPFVVDLLTGATTPAIPAVPAPWGTYRRVDIRFDRADPRDGAVSAGDPLADQTLVATGTVALNGATTPFSLVLDFNEDARFESAGGVVLPDEGPATLILRLDPARWFAGLPLARCAEAGDLPIEGGTLLLADGDGDCKDVEDVVRDAIRASGSLDGP